MKRIVIEMNVNVAVKCDFNKHNCTLLNRIKNVEETTSTDLNERQRNDDNLTPTWKVSKGALKRITVNI